MDISASPPSAGGATGGEVASTDCGCTVAGAACSSGWGRTTAEEAFSAGCGCVAGGTAVSVGVGCAGAAERSDRPHRRRLQPHLRWSSVSRGFRSCCRRSGDFRRLGLRRRNGDVEIGIMAVTHVRYCRVTDLGVSVRIIDDVPESVRILLDPDPAIRIGPGRTQEHADIILLPVLSGKDQPVSIGRHAVAVRGARPRREAPEDIVQGGILQATQKGDMPLVPFPVGIRVHDIAQHFGGFRPAGRVQVAEDRVEIHFNGTFRGNGGRAAAFLEVRIGRGQALRRGRVAGRGGKDAGREADAHTEQEQDEGTGKRSCPHGVFLMGCC